MLMAAVFVGAGTWVTVSGQVWPRGLRGPQSLMLPASSLPCGSVASSLLTFVSATFLHLRSLLTSDREKQKVTVRIQEKRRAKRKGTTVNAPCRGGESVAAPGDGGPLGGLGHWQEPDLQ